MSSQDALGLVALGLAGGLVLGAALVALVVLVWGPSVLVEDDPEERR